MHGVHYASTPTCSDLQTSLPFTNRGVRPTKINPASSVPGCKVERQSQGKLVTSSWRDNRDILPIFNPYRTSRYLSYYLRCCTEGYLLTDTCMHTYTWISRILPRSWVCTCSTSVTCIFQSFLRLCSPSVSPNKAWWFPLNRICCVNYISDKLHQGLVVGSMWDRLFQDLCIY